MRLSESSIVGTGEAWGSSELGVGTEGAATVQTHLIACEREWEWGEIGGH